MSLNLTRRFLMDSVHWCTEQLLMVNTDVCVLTGREARCTQEITGLTKDATISLSKQIVKLYLVFAKRRQRRTMTSAGTVSVVLVTNHRRPKCSTITPFISRSWQGKREGRLVVATLETGQVYKGRRTEQVRYSQVQSLNKSPDQISARLGTTDTTSWPWVSLGL